MAKNEFCDVGVLNDGHDGVTVRNGSVREFVVGVWGLAESSHNRLLGISSSRNPFSGIGFFRGTRSLVRKSSGSGSRRRRGMGCSCSPRTTSGSCDNVFRHNGDQGIFGVDSTHNLIKGTCSHTTSFTESSSSGPTAIR